MEAIRRIQPQAQLVQTEDLGKTYATPTLQYQARYENERRWLTYDILCGRFHEKHKLWKHVLKQGIDPKDLYFFLDHPCPPDIFGFNHYITSERYIDERLSNFPSHTYGGNGRHRYADVEAVRVELQEPTGISVLLKEAWERYQKPIAITEVHLHCHREEQLRWFRHVWDSCRQLKEEGVDIQAVTAWAMLGSYGWNRLLTKPGGDYEPGVFDVSNGRPRPTALAHYIKNLHHDAMHPSTLCRHKGWWQRGSRILYGSPVKEIGMKKSNHTPLLIIGKNGTLGKAFARVCESRNIPYRLLSRQDCDISRPESITEALEQYKPWAVINAAGFVRVDDAEQEHEACFRDNSHGPANLAMVCGGKGVQLISFSSDLVFDGQQQKPYVESDGVNPLNVYGRSKAESEQLVLQHYPGALVIRTSAFFSPWDEYNFVHAVRRTLGQGEIFTAAADSIISPTYVPDLVHASLDLLVDNEKGIWHLANKGALSWADLAHEVADAFDLDVSLIDARPQHELRMPATRPLYSALSSERGHILPTLEHALNRYVQEEKREKRKVA
jgi:dTDP-4-dehydrorhamnose reductase